jgi:hypothetical protein
MRSQLLLQMESLAEICWTVQRKTDDETGGGAAGAVAEDLDVFTRLAWLPGVGRETILCVLGNASLLGRQLHLDPGVLTACGRFVLACLNHSASSPSADDPSLDQIELQAEAANGLIDMFSFDECDTTVYVPLGVHAVLQQLLPRFKRVAGVRGRGKTGAASPRAAAVRDHVRAVVTNLEAFLQYKYQRNREVL